MFVVVGDSSPCSRSIDYPVDIDPTLADAVHLLPVRDIVSSVALTLFASPGSVS